MSEQPGDLELLVTEGRMADVELETFYYLDDNSPRAVIDFVAHFVVEDGEWLPKDKAVKKVLTGRKLKDIEPIAERLREEMELMAVPKE